MQSIVARVRSYLNWLVGEEETAFRTSFKRDRNDDDISSDDDSPSVKRQRKLRKTSFPDILSTEDMWDEKDRPAKNVRYIPIQVEAGYPSTSTPKEVSNKLGHRVRTVPIRLMEKSNGASSSLQNVRLQQMKPVVQTVVDDEDDDDEVILVESKPQKQTQYYKAVAQNNNNDDDDDDVIFIKEVSTAPSYYCVNKKNETRDNSIKYYKICRNLNERDTRQSPREYNKFKGTAGITKAYKKTTPLPKWMQASNTQTRNRFSTLNGNTRSTLSEVFNLDEKRSYQELIKKVADSMKPVSIGKPLDISKLADSASMRLTQRAQRNALNEIKLVEKGLSAEKINDACKEYNPITIASLNSSDSEVEIVPSETSTSSSCKIGRINSLKDSHKDKELVAKDWVTNLDSKYRKKLIDTQFKVLDAKRESDIISKVNYEQKLAHIEHKLKHELSIPESLIEEPAPTVELPPLTVEQEKLVKRALGPGPPGQLLVEKFNLRIHRRDLQTLAGLNWLNDEVINFYMNLLMQRSEERKDLPRVYATNTFFYPKLMQSGQAGLKRWTRKVDIFAHELMVVPVHLGVHWCLSLVSFRDKRIRYLDSMGGRNQPCLDALLQYLRDEHKDKKGQPFDDSGWHTENLKDIPQQMNGSDCGMFACTFAEFSARDAPYAFTQAHMPYLRRKAALEILQGRLLL